MRHTVGAMGKIDIVAGDITTQKVDAVVNAANSGLLGGGGVDGAIHRAAGPRLLDACHDLRRSTLPDGLPPGDAIATPAFDLPAKWVIHTVGPNRNAGQTDPQTLRRCFVNSLAVARGLGARTIAFPAIGAGVYGWDQAEVARIGLGVARAELARSTIRTVRFVLFGAEAEQVWRQIATKIETGA